MNESSEEEGSLNKAKIYFGHFFNVPKWLILVLHSQLSPTGYIIFVSKSITALHTRGHNYLLEITTKQPGPKMNPKNKFP